MCRMLGVVGTPAAARDLIARFRVEASQGRVGQGMAPGHRDGWGIVHVDDGLRHAGRSTLDAARDPAYPEAAARVTGTPALVHFRKSTLGAKTPENTHPFVEDGFAFCHNGTVRGVAAPGESDSRALFARLLAEIRKGAAPAEAIATLARDVDARCTYTSLTFLLTDGRSLWGFRSVGNDPVACAEDACPQDYYTLGHATLPDGSVVVSQEHEILGIAGWTPVPDGALVTVTPERRVSVSQVL
ncbi:MAG: hypothetical protein QOE90_3460 [Thermoplasmata archaeon]|jgi:glutamine amidotransferase|nr:hypothetical protein [Thermoplasmata archaeon]